MNDRNLFQRLAAITAELQTVGKNLTVKTGKEGYKAVSERDIIDAVKPLEAKHGVYSYPMKRDTVAAEILETETQYGKKTSFYSRIKTVYRFVNVDDPADFIDMEVFSVGIDPQDKGDGKAMTYGDKYALMKAYKISTGDDPDQTASEETSYKKKPKEPPKEVTEAPPEPPALCEECGKPIHSKVTKDGKFWSSQEIAALTKERFGKALCGECSKAAK